MSREITSCCLQLGETVRRKLSTYSFSQRKGISYERRVTRYLTGIYPGFCPQVTFRYSLVEEIFYRTAIVDGIYLSGALATLVEIKNEDNSAAYTQLRFYMGLVSWWSNLPVAGILIANNHRAELAPAKLEYVKGLEHARANEVSLWALSNRWLKRGESKRRFNGTRADTNLLDVPIRPGGSVGDGAFSRLCLSGMGASEGASISSGDEAPNAGAS